MGYAAVFPQVEIPPVIILVESKFPYSVKQLFVDEYPVLINIASAKEDVEEEKNDIDSMSALLNNPENAKLLKKKKY